MMPRIALITASAIRGLDEDMAPLLAALRTANAEAVECAWDDAAVDWSRFDLALLRSTWDYALRLPQFLAWVERAAAETRLINPPEVVRWNTDKHYLGELACAGVATVPGAFVEPGENADAAIAAFLTAHADAAEFVVKPCVGAGSRDAQRYAHADRADAAAHVERLLAAGRSTLLQPYLDSVDSRGETALLYFDGVFSHAICKGPLLRRGQGSTRALFAAEHITPRRPGAAELDLAERALAAIPYAGPLLYARVDLVHDVRGMPCVLELELTEPSVFLDHADDAAGRFARAILARADVRR